MKLIKKYIFIILIVIVVVGIIGGICLKNYLNNKENDLEEVVQENILEEVIEEEEEVEDIFVSVDIKGAVNKPGVYEVQNDKKVIDVVNMAEGFTNEADTSLVNLARGVMDEMVIIIYTKDQVKEVKKNEEVSIVSNNTCVCPKVTNDACLSNSNTNNTNNGSNKNNSNDNSTSNNSSSDNNISDSTNKENTNNDKVNINTATKEELMTLSGIGEGKAQSIIDYRSEVGNFSKIEDIMNVSGIGESVFEKIKEYITV